MKVYKFKCDSCGSKRYIKVEDGYKCEYCGSIQDVIMPSQPEIKEPETEDSEFNDNDVQSNSITELNGRQKSILIRLIICLFAGYLGVHKFLEGKILLGIVYTFTGGLFGVGVVLDVIRYVLKLAESKHNGGDY